MALKYKDGPVETVPDATNKPKKSTTKKSTKKNK